MGERSEHVPRVVYETLKQWKLLNSLQQIKIVANAYGRSQLYNDLERCMVIELRRFDQSANFTAKHTGVVSGAKTVFAHPGLYRLLG